MTQLRTTFALLGISLSEAALRLIAGALAVILAVRILTACSGSGPDAVSMQQASFGESCDPYTRATCFGLVNGATCARAPYCTNVTPCDDFECSVACSDLRCAEWGGKCNARDECFPAEDFEK